MNPRLLNIAPIVSVKKNNTKPINISLTAVLSEIFQKDTDRHGYHLSPYLTVKNWSKPKRIKAILARSKAPITFIITPFYQKL